MAEEVKMDTIELDIAQVNNLDEQIRALLQASQIRPDFHVLLALTKIAVNLGWHLGLSNPQSFIKYFIDELIHDNAKDERGN